MYAIYIEFHLNEHDPDKPFKNTKYKYSSILIMAYLIKCQYRCTPLNATKIRNILNQ